jgi:hypothetical protein
MENGLVVKMSRNKEVEKYENLIVVENLLTTEFARVKSYK